jgi:hypothetical protein
MLSQLSHGEGLLKPTKEAIGIAVFLVAVYLALNVVSAVLEVLKHPEVIIGLEATALAPAWDRLASACRVLDTVSQAGVGGREPMSALETSHITTAFVKALNRAELH